MNDFKDFEDFNDIIEKYDIQTAAARIRGMHEIQEFQNYPQNYY